MAHNCRLLRDDNVIDSTWRREGDYLLFSPDCGTPLSLPLGEVSAIDGDGFSLLLRSPLGDLRLERLGADGPTLLQELRRDWPPLRARMMRLADDAAPAPIFAGRVQGPTGSGEFRGFLVEDRFVYAINGADVAALPLCDCKSVVLDATSFSVRCWSWDGLSDTVFTKLGGQTQALANQLRAARGHLAAEADETIARHLPTLPMLGRSTLASQWLPGRVLSFAALEALAPGFEAAFLASWLAHSHRNQEGLDLMRGVALGDRWLGYARPGRTLAPGASPQEEAQLLWLLVRNGEGWSLELLSQGDFATYLFTGGAEVPWLVGGVIRFPEFSREALYKPLADLVDERAEYAIAARDLPLLRDLRSRFSGRRIHAPRTRSESPAP